MADEGVRYEADAEAVAVVPGEGLRAVAFSWLALGLALLSLVPLVHGSAIAVTVAAFLVALVVAQGYGSVSPSLPEFSRSPAALRGAVRSAARLQEAASRLTVGGLITAAAGLVWAVVAAADAPAVQARAIAVAAGVVIVASVQTARIRYGAARPGVHAERGDGKVRVVIGGQRLVGMEGVLWLHHTRFVAEHEQLDENIRTSLARAVDLSGGPQCDALARATTLHERKARLAAADDFSRLALTGIQDMIRAATIDVSVVWVPAVAAVVMVGQIATLTRWTQARQLKWGIEARLEWEKAETDPIPAQVPADVTNAMTAVLTEANANGMDAVSRLYAWLEARSGSNIPPLP